MNKTRKFVYTFAAVILLVVIIYIVVNHMKSSLQEEKQQLVVNGIRLDKKELDSEIKKAQLFEKWVEKEKIKKDSSKSAETTATEKLIEETLAKDFAEKQKIIVSDTEIERHYKKAADSLGGEEKYLAKLKEIYGMEKDEVLEMISYDLLKQKISQKVGLPFDAWMKEEKSRVKIDIEK